MKKEDPTGSLSLAVEQSRSNQKGNSDTTVYATSELTAVDLETELLRNRYRIIRDLGRGGMAVVYAAEHIDTGDQVAIKTMSSRLTGTAKQRFTREFSTIASIKHPHCLTVHEYGETQAGPYFVMELFNAQPVTMLIGQPLNVILKAIYQLADAVDFVHSRRIIHRDLKPGNMLARKSGDHFEVRLADFGLAKFANTSSSMSADVNFLGTLAYCAPEQIMREELDTRADIYAFGIVCYELLTGTHPFQEARRSVQSLISKHLRETPVRVEQLAKQVPDAIARLISAMLDKQPGRRPPSLKTLRQAIATHMGWSIEGNDDSSFPSRSQRLAPTFVARDAERDALESLVSKCLKPQQAELDEWQVELPPSVVFVTGDAGIGKSSLMRQVARSALIEGAKIYEGRCFEGSLSPFQPIVAIVKQLLVEQSSYRARASDEQLDDAYATTTLLQSGDSTTRVDEVLDNYAPELHRIGPELRNLLPGKAFEQAEMAAESDYIYRAVATFFIELGKVQPTCILIDDLQWADQASRTLLRHISAAIDDDRLEASRSGAAPSRLMACCTSRSGPDYPSVESYMQSAPNTERIHLEEFDLDAMQKLIASAIGSEPEAVDERLVTLVRQQCLGNPFYITSTLREWLTQGKLRFEDKRWRIDQAHNDDSSVSLSVREGLRKRVGTLDKLPKQIASLAAVIGKVVEVNLLTEVLNEIQEFDILDAFDELFARNILIESPQARHVEFTHDLVREVLLEQLSQSRRRALHRSVGEALEQQQANGKPISITKLAEHLTAAGEDERAFEYLLTAGQEAVSAFAHADAVKILSEAEKLTTKIYATEEALFNLWLTLANAYAAGEYSEKAEPYFEKALLAAPIPEDYAKAVIGYTALTARQNRVDFSIELTNRGLEKLNYYVRRVDLQLSMTSF